MQNLTVKIKRKHPDAIMPTYGSEGAACFDLYAAYDFSIYPKDTVVVDTGIIFETPPGYGLFLFSRSSLSVKDHLLLVNGVGVIDSDYRNSVGVPLRNLHHATAYFGKAGDRISQARFQKLEHADFVWDDNLTTTVRGEGGFGSTGR